MKGYEIELYDCDCCGMGYELEETPPSSSMPCRDAPASTPRSRPQQKALEDAMTKESS